MKIKKITWGGVKRGSKSKNKPSFTLAEVLVTLTIIGVVAALTVPLLTANHKKTEYASKIKKFFSTMTDVYAQAESDFDLSPNFYIADQGRITTKEYFDTYIAPYLKYTRVEETGHVNLQRFDYNTIVYLDDGMKVYLQDLNADRYMRYLLDVNGDKGPNMMGRDLFQFWWGWHNKFEAYYPFDNDPDREHYKNLCRADNEQHFHCAALVQNDGWEFKDDYPLRL